MTQEEIRRKRNELEMDIQDFLHKIVVRKDVLKELEKECKHPALRNSNECEGMLVCDDCEACFYERKIFTNSDTSITVRTV